MPTGRIWISLGRMLVCCVDVDIREKKMKSQLEFHFLSTNFHQGYMDEK